LRRRCTRKCCRFEAILRNNIIVVRRRSTEKGVDKHTNKMAADGGDKTNPLSFHLQIGLTRETVTVEQAEGGDLMMLKEIACEFVDRKVCVCVLHTCIPMLIVIDARSTKSSNVHMFSTLCLFQLSVTSIFRNLDIVICAMQCVYV
jgi:hypothetical protein